MGHATSGGNGDGAHVVRLRAPTIETVGHVMLRQRLWNTALKRCLANHELDTSWARTHELRRELGEAIEWARRERRRSRWLRRTSRPLPRVVTGT